MLPNYKNEIPYSIKVEDSQHRTPRPMGFCSADRTRTDDLWDMNPTSYQLLHRAMFDKYTKPRE